MVPTGSFTASVEFISSFTDGVKVPIPTLPPKLLSDKSLLVPAESEDWIERYLLEAVSLTFPSIDNPPPFAEALEWNLAIRALSFAPWFLSKKLEPPSIWILEVGSVVPIPTLPAFIFKLSTDSALLKPKYPTLPSAPKYTEESSSLTWIWEPLSKDSNSATLSPLVETWKSLAGLEVPIPTEPWKFAKPVTVIASLKIASSCTNKSPLVVMLSVLESPNVKSPLTPRSPKIVTLLAKVLFPEIVWASPVVWTASACKPSTYNLFTKSVSLVGEAV